MPNILSVSNRLSVIRTYAILIICETIQDLFERWITSEMDALDIPEFSVDGVAIGTGSPPALNNAVCSVTYPLELSGSFV